MKLYGTERYQRIGTTNLGDQSLNGIYTASFYLNGQFADWTSAGLTNVIDGEIPEEAYTGEIVPGVKKLTRFVSCEYNENYVDPVELTRSLKNVGAAFNVDIFPTKEDAILWIRENTSLLEESEGKFLISPESDIMGQVVPARYLTIE